MQNEYKQIIKIIANSFVEQSIFEKQRNQIITYEEARLKTINFINSNHGVIDLKLAIYVYAVLYKKDMISTLTFFEIEGYNPNYIYNLLEGFYGKQNL